LKKKPKLKTDKNGKKIILRKVKIQQKKFQKKNSKQKLQTTIKKPETYL